MLTLPPSLKPAFALTRTVGAPAAAAAQGAAAPAADEASSPAASTKVRVVGFALLVVGGLIAILVHGKHSAFDPKPGFVLFAGFYVAAQSVERLLELVLPPGQGTAQAQADRTILVGALAFLLGIALSLILGLRFLSAVQVGTPPRWLDVFVTGLVIGAGTKSLHDLLGLIQNSGG